MSADNHISPEYNLRFIRKRLAPYFAGKLMNLFAQFEVTELALAFAGKVPL